MVPKKSPKSPKMPKLSTMNPTNDHFIKINTIPNAKQSVPRILVGLVKNVTVLCGPIINTNPITKRMFPRARRPESKNVMMPKRKKIKPPAVKPTPNSAG